MRKILTSVEILENKSTLRFSYDDNSQKDYLINVDTQKRTIKIDNDNYSLIESSEQVRERMQNIEEYIDFEKCIFLINPRFHGDQFTMYASFSHSIFSNGASFDSAIFKKNVSFNSAQFTQYASFSKAKFDKTKLDKETSFNLAIFNKIVAFKDAEFSGEVKFLGTIFNDEVDFGVHTASDNKLSTDILHLPEFSEKVDFTDAVFKNVLNFSGVKSIELDLRHTIIDRMEYNNTEFSSDNRETFLTLKNVALKQNDQIKALEFHTQEYQTYLKSLRKNKTNKNLLDRFILTFECCTSAFGTSAIRSIGSFVFIVILFYVSINGFNYDARTIVDFASPLSYDIDKIFRRSDDVSDVGRYLFFLYKILQVALIYEMIKSFRKFSRTL